MTARTDQLKALGFLVTVCALPPEPLTKRGSVLLSLENPDLGVWEKIYFRDFDDYEEWNRCGAGTEKIIRHEKGTKFVALTVEVLRNNNTLPAISNSVISIATSDDEKHRVTVGVPNRLIDID